MKIAVLTKQVPDTYDPRKLDLESGLLDRSASASIPDEIGERALEVALQFKDAAPETEVVLISMGTEDTVKSLRKLMAMGADSAVLVTDPALAGSDYVQTARVLAAAIRRVAPELVIAGNESTDGRGGVVPAMVAEIVDAPYLPGIDDPEITSTTIFGSFALDGGMAAAKASLPAIVSVTEKAAEPRVANFKGIRAAKSKPLTTWSLDDLDVNGVEGGDGPQSVMVSAVPRPPKQAGPKLEDDGSAGQQLVDFLASHRLV